MVLYNPKAKKNVNVDRSQVAILKDAGWKDPKTDAELNKINAEENKIAEKK